MNLQIILGLYAAVSAVSFILTASLVILDGKLKNWWKIPVYSLFWPVALIKAGFTKSLFIKK